MMSVFQSNFPLTCNAHSAHRKACGLRQWGIEEEWEHGIRTPDDVLNYLGMNDP